MDPIGLILPGRHPSSHVNLLQGSVVGGLPGFTKNHPNQRATRWDAQVFCVVYFLTPATRAELANLKGPARPGNNLLVQTGASKTHLVLTLQNCQLDASKADGDWTGAVSLAGLSDMIALAPNSPVLYTCCPSNPFLLQLTSPNPFFNLPLFISDLAGLELGHGGGGPPRSQSRPKNLRTRLETVRQVRNSGICQTLLFGSQTYLLQPATLPSFIGSFWSVFSLKVSVLKYPEFSYYHSCEAC